MLGVAGSDSECPFPPSAAAAAARCESAEQSGGAAHYLVAVLCELGRGMHAWQAMASVFNDKSKHPSHQEWADAVQYNGAADPRKMPFQPEQPPKSDFEKALEAMSGPPAGGGMNSGVAVSSPLGVEWERGRLKEIVSALSHDFWSETKDMADFLPELQATLPKPETEEDTSKLAEPQTAEDKKQAAYEALMARRAAQQGGDGEGGASKPKKERKKRVRKKVVEEEYEDDEDEGESSGKQEL
jgi:hypothetical protein